MGLRGESVERLDDAEHVAAAPEPRAQRSWVPRLLLVFALVVATCAAPAVGSWAGGILLASVAATFVPGLRRAAGALLRLRYDRPIRAFVKRAAVVVFAVALFGLSHIMRELREEIAAANTEVAALVGRAKVSLAEGDLDAAGDLLARALEVARATDRRAAEVLVDAIERSGDATRMEAALVELPDAEFMALSENGELPRSLRSGHEVIDDKAESLALERLAAATATRREREERAARAAEERARVERERREARDRERDAIARVRRYAPRFGAVDLVTEPNPIGGGVLVRSERQSRQFALAYLVIDKHVIPLNGTSTSGEEDPRFLRDYPASIQARAGWDMHCDRDLLSYVLEGTAQPSGPIDQEELGASLFMALNVHAGNDAHDELVRTSAKYNQLRARVDALYEKGIDDETVVAQIRAAEDEMERMLSQPSLERLDELVREFASELSDEGAAALRAKQDEWIALVRRQSDQ